MHIYMPHSLGNILTRRIPVADPDRTLPWLAGFA